MKHCRHAITVKLEACNVCSPAGNVLRATRNAQHAPNKLPVQFSPQLFDHFAQIFIFILPSTQAKLRHITYLRVPATGATRGIVYKRNMVKAQGSLLI